MTFPGADKEQYCRSTLYFAWLKQVTLALAAESSQPTNDHLQHRNNTTPTHSNNNEEPTTTNNHAMNIASPVRMSFTADDAELDQPLDDRIPSAREEQAEEEQQHEEDNDGQETQLDDEDPDEDPFSRLPPPPRKRSRGSSCASSTFVPAAIKRQVITRANRKCWLCGQFGKHVAHVIAKADNILVSRLSLHPLPSASSSNQLLLPVRGLQTIPAAGDVQSALDRESHLPLRRMPRRLRRARPCVDVPPTAP